VGGVVGGCSGGCGGGRGGQGGKDEREGLRGKEGEGVAGVVWGKGQAITQLCEESQLVSKKVVVGDVDSSVAAHRDAACLEENTLAHKKVGVVNDGGDELAGRVHCKMMDAASRGRVVEGAGYGNAVLLGLPGPVPGGWLLPVLNGEVGV